MLRDAPCRPQFKAPRPSAFRLRVLPPATFVLGVVLISYTLVAAPGAAASDTAGPSITNVTVSPTTVAAGQSFGVSFDLQDPSGLGDQAGRAHWLLNGTEQALIYRCYSSGGPTDLHCSGTVAVPAGAASGTYAPIDFRAWDQLNNETLAAERLPSITVTGGSSDTAGPSITNVTVSPTTVAAGQSFGVSFDLQDPSGLGDQAGRAHWLLNGTEQALIYRCNSSGRPTDLHCSGTVAVPAGAASGTYAPIDFRAWDQLNNETLAAERLPSIIVTGGATPTSTPTPTPTATDTPTHSGISTATPPVTSAPLPASTASQSPGQRLPVLQGSNLVAWPFTTQPVGTALGAFSKPVAGIYEYNPPTGAWKRYFPDLPQFLNNLDVLANGSTYWVVIN